MGVGSLGGTPATQMVVKTLELRESISDGYENKGYAKESEAVPVRVGLGQAGGHSPLFAKWCAGA